MKCPAATVLCSPKPGGWSSCSGKPSWQHAGMGLKTIPNPPCCHVNEAAWCVNTEVRCSTVNPPQAIRGPAQQQSCRHADCGRLSTNAEKHMICHSLGTKEVETAEMNIPIVGGLRPGMHFAVSSWNIVSNTLQRSWVCSYEKGERK